MSVVPCSAGSAFVHRIHFTMCQFTTCQEIYKKSCNEKKVLEEFSSLCGQMVGSLLNMSSPQFD